jgi:hypothetical protein
VYLGSARPRLTATVYLAGAVLMSLIIVVLINVLLVWLPITVYLIAPGLTTRYLTGFNGWLRVHGKAILVGVFIVAGAIMIGNGNLRARRGQMTRFPHRAPAASG